MRTSKRTRFASIFLSFLMVVNLFPFTAAAVETEPAGGDAVAELASANSQASAVDSENADKASNESTSVPVASYTVSIALPGQGVALADGQSKELLAQTVSAESAMESIRLVSTYADEPFDESVADAFNSQLFGGTGLTATFGKGGVITISGTPTANVAVNLADAFAENEPATVTDATTEDTSAIYVSSEGNDSTGNGSEASPYATIGQAYSAVADKGAICLLSDVDVSSQITFGTAKTVTITSADSNNVKTIYSKVSFGYETRWFFNVNSGHVVFKNITIDGEYQKNTNGNYYAPGAVVASSATVTIDSGTTIQNFKKNAGNSGGAAVVKSANSGAVVNIKDGVTIKDCVLETGSADDPAAVLSSGTGAILYMTGGTVTGNTLSTSQANTTAVVNIGKYNNPHFWMTGGKITGNTINNGAAAVYMRGAATDCDIEFGDTAYVYGNYVSGSSGDQRNIYLKNNSNGSEDSSIYAKLCSALTSEAKLGVYAEKIGMGTKVAQGGGVSGVGTGSYTATAADATYFVSDKATDAEILYCGGGEDTCGLLQHKEGTTHEKAIYLSVSPAVTATKNTTNTDQIDLSITRCTSDATYVVLDKDMKPVTGKTLTGGAYETDGNTFKLSDSTTSTTIDMAGLDKASGPYTVMLVGTGGLTVTDDKADTSNLTDIATVNIVNFAGDGVKWSGGTTDFENGDFDIVTVPHNDQSGKATKSYTATTKTNYTFAETGAITGKLDNTDKTAATVTATKDESAEKYNVSVTVPAYGATNYNTVTLTGATSISTGVKLLDKTDGTEMADGKTYDGVAVTHSEGAIEDVTLNYTWQKKNAEGDGYTDIADNAAPSDAGEYNLKVTVTKTDATTELGTENLPFTITPKTLTVTATAQDKTYDGGTTATLKDATLNDVLDADKENVTLETGGVSAEFGDKNVGTGKSVTLTSGYTLSGTAAGNYTVAQPTGLTAAITQREVTVSGLAAAKTYDGDDTAAKSEISGDPVVGNKALDADDVSLNTESMTGKFNSADVDKATTVTLSGLSLTGTDATNYKLPATVTCGGTITKADGAGSVKLDGWTYGDKANAPQPTSATNGTDSVTYKYKVKDANDNTYSDTVPTNAGDYTVKATFSATNNYNAVVATADFAIAKKALTMTASAQDKTYDGNADATVDASLDKTGVADTDEVSLDTTGVTASFDTKDAGEGKPVTVSGEYKLSGAAAGNYTLKEQPSSLKANIAAASLTIAGATVTAKTYDGNDGATITSVIFDGLKNGETLAADTDYTVSDAKYNGVNAAGDDAATKVDFNVALSNTDVAKNYALASNAGSQAATIGKATHGDSELSTKGHRGESNEFSDASTHVVTGGTVGSNVTVNDANGILDGTPTYDSGTGKLTYTLKSTATEGQTATVTLPVTSANYNDYNIVVTIGITPKETAEIVITAGTYEYNGAAQAPTDITVTDNKVQVAALEVAYEGAEGTVYEKSSLAPTNAGKYVMTVRVPDENTKYTGSATCAFEITKKALTATIAAEDKTYDGNTAATVTASLTGVVEGDGDKVTAVVANPVFEDKNVGEGKKVTASVSLSGDAASNYTVNGTAETKASITAKEVSITGVTIEGSKTYDKSAAATITSSGAIDGKVTTDSLTITAGKASYDNANAGTGKTVTFAGFALDGTDAKNYKLTGQPASTTANITAKEVSISGVAIETSKVYNGNAEANITNSGTLNGVLGGDTVTVKSGTAAYGDKNVGEGKTVTFSGFSLEGDDAGNYVLKGQPADTSAAITQREVTVSGLAAAKTYDGDDTAAKSEISGDPVVGNKALDADDVSLNTESMTGKFNSADVDKATTVTLSGLSLTGTDATNYKLPETVTCKGTIAKANGAGSVELDGWTYGDEANAPQPTSATNGTDKVTYQYKVKGADDNTYSGTVPTNAGEYTVEATFAATNNHNAVVATYDFAIAKKALTVTATAKDKTYDGNADATVDASLDKTGVADTDEVSLDTTGVTASFDTKDAGEGKPVTVSGEYKLSGAAAGNYTLTQPSGLTANITKKSLTATITAKDKTYDGNTAATVTASLEGVVEGDSGKVAADVTNPAFADKNMGEGKAVTAAISLSGTAAGNYTVNSEATTTATISAKEVGITGVTVEASKTYDKSAAAVITSNGAIGGKVETDDLAIVAGAASYDNANVGTGKAVSFAGFALAGDDAGNYKLKEQPASTTANITAKELTVTATASDKVYDGKTEATVTEVVLAGAVEGDSVSLNQGSMTAAFEDANVGTGKTVTVSGLSLDNNENGNYKLPDSITATASITRAGGIGAVTLEGWTYGDTAKTPTATSTTNPGSESSPITYQYKVKEAADDTYTAAVPADAGTYTVKATFPENGNYTAATATADFAISPKELTVNVTAQDKEYDGTANATLNDATLVGVVEADANNVTVVTSGVSAAFNSKDAGTGKPIMLTGAYTLSGDAAKNYTVAQPTGLKANVTAATLTITGATVTAKTYDGNDGATITSVTFDGLRNGETLTANTDYTVSDAKYNGVNAAGDDAATKVDFNVALSNTDVAKNYALASNAGSQAATIGKATHGDSELSTKGHRGETNTLDGVSSYVVATGTVGEVATAGDEIFDGTPAYDSSAGKLTYTLKSTATEGQTATVTLPVTSANYADYSIVVTVGVTAKDTAEIVIAAGTYEYNGTAQAPTDVTVTGDKVPVDTLEIAYKSEDGAAYPESATAPTNAGKYVMTVRVPDSNNRYTGSATCAFEITKKALTATIAAEDKTYDGNTAATVTASLTGVVEGDSGKVTAKVTNPAFADKNADGNKKVTAGITLSGDAANNYTVNSEAATTANITAKEVTASITAESKVFDGTTAAEATSTLTGAVAGDVVYAKITGAEFADANVADGKQVTAAIELAGDAAANYSVNKTATANANITAKSLTLTIKANDKKLDGSDAAVLDTENATLDGMVSGHLVSVGSAKGTFESYNTASDAASVNVTDVKLEGEDAGNYEIAKINSVTAKLTPLYVTFMDGDAKLDEKTISVYGTAPTDVVLPEKSGYNFAGWYTDEDCTAPWNGKAGVTADATVYAKWSTNALYTLNGVVKQGDAAKSDVSVTLYEGSAGIAATTTDANGMYSFGNVPNGTYTITAKASDRAATTTVAVQDGDITQDIVLPATAVATEVQVAPGAPAVTVSGIDEALVDALVASDGNEVTAPKDGERLEVKLNVKADASEDEKAAIQDAAIQEIGREDTNWYFVNMDVDWSKYNLEGHIGSGNIADTVNVLAIRVPYDRDDKRDIVVYRHHMNGTTVEVTQFTQLQSEPAEGSYTDGTCYVGDDYIMLYTQKFSAFGIGYINDATDPVISCPEDGKTTYCGPVTLTITDEEIAQVTVNGKEVSLDADGHLTLNPADGEQTVVAVDAARNSSSITVTVNNGHTWGTWASNGNGTHTRTCKLDDAHTETADCHGGTATCSEPAACDDCGQPYGEVDPGNHAALAHVDAKEASETAEGNIEYWYCSACNKYFADPAGKREISQAETTVAKRASGPDGNKGDSSGGKPDDAEPGKSKLPATGDTAMAVWPPALLGATTLATAFLFSKRKRAE